MNKSAKNICVITGSRADYDLLQPIIKGLSKIINGYSNEQN